MGPIELSIVMVSWNVRNPLRKGLASIFAHAGQMAAEFSVIDNHSSDRSADMIVKEFPRVSLIRNTKNVGFARANNMARKHNGSGSVVLATVLDMVKNIWIILFFLTAWGVLMG